jgi:hypothetical protein
MTEVAADLPALDALSDRTVGRRDQLDQVRSRMSAVRLPRDAFGYIPGIGARVHDAYEQFMPERVIDQAREQPIQFVRAGP